MKLEGIRFAKIPEAMRSRAQWVLWKLVTRDDQPTKIPFQASGDGAASSTDPKTWADFVTVQRAYERDPSKWAGIGYVFSKDDPFVGIDLDGCRDPKTGKVTEWAREILLAVNSYAEVSPSQTGVKIITSAKSPLDRGRKKAIDAPKVEGKEPAIEMYDFGRYFAITGWQVQGPDSPEPRQDEVNALAEKFFHEEHAAPATARFDYYGHNAVTERARKYLAKMEPSVTGQGGHNKAFAAACAVVLGFGLEEGAAMELLREWNQSCQPPWSERELQHKVNQAAKQPGERNYLRNVQPAKWDNVQPRTYTEPYTPPKREPIKGTLKTAMMDYLSSMDRGEQVLVKTDLFKLDDALKGGIDFGELVLVPARPSHGKSAFALQLCHHWTLTGLNCLFVSEEMSKLSLGQRTLLFSTPIPPDEWEDRRHELMEHVSRYCERTGEGFVIEGCGTIETVIEQIEAYVANHNVRCVLVDYAQLLQSTNRKANKYELVSMVSTALKQAAQRLKIILVVLCQLSREIEKRDKFIPKLSDIRDSGQLEQDADIVVFIVRPWMVSKSNPIEDYQFFVAKNRNRGLPPETMVVCKFDQNRQMISTLIPEADDWDSTEFG